MRSAAIDKDIQTFLDGNIVNLIEGIEVDQSQLVCRRSETFTQQFLKDSRGKHVTNEPVHNIMHRFIRYAQSKGYNKYLLLGAMGFGKCFCQGNQILMYDCSFKKVENVKVGDLLMGPDSKPRKVLFLGNGKEQAYKITLFNKDSFSCNESHILHLVFRRDAFGYKKDDKINILLKDYFELPEWVRKYCLRLYKVPVEFEYQSTPMYPYDYGQSIGNFRKKHGDRHTQFYRIWSKIKERCDNLNCKHYSDYGGRGIKYNPKWENYLEFKKDMYFKYLYAKKQLKIKNLSIERLNVNGDYVKENCIFIDLKDQIKNTRRNKWFKAISPEGKEYTSNSQTEFAQQHGLDQVNISHILLGKTKKSRHGWTFHYIKNPNKKFKISNRKKINKENGINKKYIKNSMEVRLQVLAGYLDIHGSVCPGDNAESYKTTTRSKQLCDDILLLCRSLGFSVSFYEELVNKTIFYRIIISGNTWKIPCKIKKIIKVERNRKKRSPLEYSFKIEDIGEQEYFGFGLDDDHLFLLHDFTVAHNTESICTGWVMHEIAKNPNLLCKIVHVSETEAVKRCRALRDYIQKDDDLHRIAPHIMPTPIWGSQRFICKRSAMSKDGTVEAYGVLSTAIGGRANLIVFDDPQDLKTAVLEPTTRQKIEDVFKNIWLTRLIPQDSQVLVMMNKWHQSLTYGEVLTLDGIKDISECKINDYVYTSKGFQPVLKTDKAPFIGDVYKIIPWYLSGLEAEYTHDHEIKTKEGYKHTSKLTKHDYLEVPIYTYEGDWQKDIISTFPSKYKYKGRGYKSKPNLPISLDEFKILLKSNLTYKQISKILKVSVGHIYYCARYYKLNNKHINDLSENIFNDLQFWKILGYWLAEGSLTYGTKKENRDVIRFTFGLHEKEYIDEVIQFFDKYNIHCGEDYTNTNSCTLKISSFQLSQWLKINFSEGSYNKKLPLWFFGLSEDFFFKFLEGYLNGDGCLNKDNDNIFRFSSVSKSLLHGIQLNLLRFGYISSIYKNKTEGIKRVNFGFGEVTINCKESYELKIYDKEKKYAFIENDKLYVKIRKIKKRKFIGYVYDISTPTHDFCSSGYLVHNSDLAAVLQRNPVWSWMSIAVSEDINHIIYEDSFGRKKLLPLWSKFNKQDLQMRVKELGQRDFDRGYRLIPYTDSDKSFPSFRKCCHFGVKPEQIIDDEKNWIFFGGIDFAGLKRPGTVLSVIGVHKKTGLKLPVEVVSLRGTQDLPFYLLKFFRKYGVDFFMAENNGVQDTIIDMLISMMGQEKYKKYGIKIEGFLTGKNKADPIFGLPSMEKEFDNQEWMFCFDHEPQLGEEDTNDPWMKMFYEFMHHPFYETTDIVMSMWFCRESSKMFLRGNEGPQIY